MDPVEQFVVGAVLASLGLLLAIDHPLVDWFNRAVKAAGTTQRPADIEMNATSVLVGRVVGTAAAVLGIAFLLEVLLEAVLAL